MTFNKTDNVCIFSGTYFQQPMQIFEMKSHPWCLRNPSAASFQPSRLAHVCTHPSLPFKTRLSSQTVSTSFSEATAKKWAINLMKAKRSEQESHYGISRKTRVVFLFLQHFSNFKPCLVSWEAISYKLLNSLYTIWSIHHLACQTSFLEDGWAQWVSLHLLDLLWRCHCLVSNT